MGTTEKQSRRIQYINMPKHRDSQSNKIVSQTEKGSGRGKIVSERNGEREREGGERET